MKGQFMTLTTRWLMCGLSVLALTIIGAASAGAQTVSVTRNVNLRPEQSSAEPPIRLLTPAEPPMALIEPHVQDGYLYVKTAAGEEGYVWSKSVRVSAAPLAATI